MMHDGGRDRHARLEHHFEDMVQQYESGKLGMWIFLVTEILLFGGLFCAYAVYRANHPETFLYAHHYLDKTLGGVNTLVLIGSSLTMAWAVRSAQLGDRRRLTALLTATLILAAVFLGVKGVEYEHKWRHNLLWGKRYAPVEHVVEDHAGSAPIVEAAGVGEPDRPPAGGGDETTLPAAGAAPAGLAADAAAPPAHPAGDVPRNVQLFFSIYFVMTGLHGLHVLAGMGVIGWILMRARRGEFGPDYFAPVDFTGLYWHLVDLIWIFLFPLLYLIH